jgi:hypothetical protein
MATVKNLCEDVVFNANERLFCERDPAARLLRNILHVI